MNAAWCWLNKQKDTKMNYEKITLGNTNARNIAFKGILLGCIKTAEKNGRWLELSIYKTYKGFYVACTTEYSKWVGENTTISSKLCKHNSEVFEALGFSDCAKELYDNVGIEHAEYINEVTHMVDSQFVLDKENEKK